MIWISNGIVIILLTGLISAIWSAVWMLVKAILSKRGHVVLISRLQKFVLLGYVLPIFYLIEGGSQFFEDRNVKDRFLLYTPVIHKIAIGVLAIWIIVMAIKLVQWIKEMHTLKWLSDMPGVSYKVDTYTMQKLRTELRIKKTIRFGRKYEVPLPFIHGYRDPAICMPMKPGDGQELQALETPPEDLEMILRHELLHYQHRDTLWKPVFSLVCCIFWFQPLAWNMLKQLECWSEARCDYECVKKYGGHKYFDMILCKGMEAAERINTMTPMWSRETNELKWRIKCMKANKGKTTSKWVAVVTTTLMIITSCAATYAADMGVEKLYTVAYDATRVEVSEDINIDLTKNEYEEHIGSADDWEGLTGIEDTSSGLARSRTIEWTLKNKEFYTTGYFWKDKSDTIYIAGSVTPEGYPLKVGIAQPNGVNRYISPTGNFAHEFSLTQTGLYKVYAENTTGVTLTLTAMYK